MVDKITAAESIRTLARQYQYMVDAADVLEQIGSLENAVAEAKAATVAAQLERDIALAEVKKAKASVAAANEKAASIEQAALDKANEIVSSAQEMAATVLASAKDKAEKYTANSLAMRDEAIAVADANLVELAKRIDAAKIELAEAQSKADAAIASATDSQARLAKVQASIRKLAEA